MLFDAEGSPPRFRVARTYLGKHLEAGECWNTPIRHIRSHSGIPAMIDYAGPINHLQGLGSSGDIRASRNRRLGHTYMSPRRTCSRCHSPTPPGDVTRPSAFTAWSPLSANSCSSRVSSSDRRDTRRSIFQNEMGLSTLRRQQATRASFFPSEEPPYRPRSNQGFLSAADDILTESEAEFCLSNVSRTIDKLIKETLDRPALGSSTKTPSKRDIGSSKGAITYPRMQPLRTNGPQPRPFYRRRLPYGGQKGA